MTICNKIIITFCILLCFHNSVKASAFEYGYTSDGFKYVIHKHNESSYQHAWCSEHNGIEEYENSDFTRVDCLTDTHAIEFDFANKLAESIGQALHYSFMTANFRTTFMPDSEQIEHTVPKVQMRNSVSVEKIQDGKRAKVVLILENPEKQMCYFERVQNLGKIHNFDVEYVTPEILTLTDNKCQFPDCRCHKKKCKITVGLRRKNRDFENYFGAKNCTLLTIKSTKRNFVCFFWLLLI